MSLQIRRGPTADRLTITPESGELIYDLTEQKLYIGDGITVGGTPASDFTPTDAQIAAATLLTDGAYSNLAFAYDAEANELSGSIDLTSYDGTIEATSFTGSVLASDETVLLDAISAGVNLDGTVKGNIIPSVNVSYDIGSTDFRFRDLYLSGSSLHLGDAVITASGSAVNLPAGSLINGLPIGGGGTGDGVVEGSNYRINIIGDDSTIIVNSDTRTVTAANGFTGNLTGDVTGNLFGGVISTDGSTFLINPFDDSVRAAGGVFGDVTGDVTGNIFGNLFGNVSGNVTGNVAGDVTGNVSGNVFGSVTGIVYGDLRGSVFGDDSVVIIDGTEGSFSGKLGSDLDTNGFRIDGSQVVIAPDPFVTGGGRTIIGSASALRNGSLAIVRPFFYGDAGIYAGARTDGRSGFLFAQHHNNIGVDRMVFYRTRRDEIANTYTPVLSGDQVGEVNFTAMSVLPADLPGAPTAKESDTTASIRVVVDGTPNGKDAPGRIEFRTNTGTANTLHARLNKSGVFAVNTLSGLTATLTVSGNFIVTGNVTAGIVTADLKGSVYADDSTVIIDGTNGTIPGYISVATLKSITAASATYAAFQSAVAAL